MAAQPGTPKSDKRKQILRLAERLFSRYGSKRVTIEEICKQAGVSKPTFYKHFKNKFDLVRTLHDDLVDRGFARFDEICAMQIPFPAKIDLMGQWKAGWSKNCQQETVSRGEQF